jgi:phage anti-repressor protein
MQSLDIVNLIESNPITKLTNDYNNKLLIKIKQNFTETEQQLFISSFYCYLNYNSTTDFVIDLDNVWKWLEFASKFTAIRTLEKSFILDKDYKIFASPNSEANINEKKRGGHNIKKFLLNIQTFKLFCIKAETSKAKEIHEYFIKLEEILQQTIQEESNELKLQLEQAKNEIVQIEEKNKKTVDEKVLREREQMLLREYGNIGSVFYIIKVKTNADGTYVVKVGESRKGVQGRYNEHKYNYEEALLLDCFSVDNSKDFESFILSHEHIKFNKVTNLPNHENANELLLIGKKLTYKMLLDIVNTNIKKFDNNIKYLLVENETLKNVIASSKQLQEQYNYTLEIKELLNTQKEMMKIIKNLEKSNKEILEKLNPPQIKTTTGFQEPLVNLGPRLQQIHPEGLTLVKVFESVAECIKESNFVMKRPSIQKAVTENTVYQGYRWMYVERDNDPTIITNIAPTKQTKAQNLGYIAKLNSQKNEIINVYLDRKTAAINNGYESSSAIDNHVKNESLTKGHYYVLFDKCPEELRDAFIEKCGEPLLYKDGIGQYDSTGNLIKEFVCKYDCIKKLQISDKTLTKALDKQVMYNNSYFRTIGSKLQSIK